ncbi:hypothetical protein ACLESO_32840, partial [Pyxidicoccus sp. 3LG]
MKGPTLPALKHGTMNAALTETARTTSLGLTFVDVAEREVTLSWAEVHRRARRTGGGAGRGSE